MNSAWLKALCKRAPCKSLSTRVTIVSTVFQLWIATDSWFIVPSQLSSSLFATTARPSASRRSNTTLCCPRPLCTTTLEVRSSSHISVGSTASNSDCVQAALVWRLTVSAMSSSNCMSHSATGRFKRAMMIRNIKLNRPDLRRDVVMIAPCSQCLEQNYFSAVLSALIRIVAYVVCLIL